MLAHHLLQYLEKSGINRTAGTRLGDVEAFLPNARGYQRVESARPEVCQHLRLIRAAEFNNTITATVP